MNRRKQILLVALLTIAGSAGAQTLSVAPIEAKAGEQATLSVSVTGATAMTALQFNLSLPEGVTVADGATTQGAATDGHELKVETLDNGDRLFVLYSMDLNRFRDGELLRIPVTIGNNAKSGKGQLPTVRFATTEAVSQKGTDATFDITVHDYILGDVNGDDNIDLTDAIMIVYASLGSVPAGFVEAAADVNGDNKIDLTDAITVVYKSLGAQQAPKRMVEPD